MFDCNQCTFTKNPDTGEQMLETPCIEHKDACCTLCYSTEGLGYCKLCKRWFCLDCKRKYPKRVKAAMKELINRFR